MTSQHPETPGRKLTAHNQEGGGRNKTQALVYIVTFIGCIIFLFPFASMISTSLKSYAEAKSLPVQLIPRVIRWSNYREAIRLAPFFWRWMLNSAFLSLVPTVGIVLASSMAGYAFARLRAPFKNQLFAIVLATLMLPTTAMVVPIFLFWRSFHAIGTYWPLILPFFCGDAFNVFLFRQFFAGMPKELEDAAIMDGCSRFRIWWAIFLPNSFPVIATSAIWFFNWRWNEYLTPRFFLNAMETYPLSVGLTVAYSKDMMTPIQLVSVAAVIFTIPTIIIFALGQKYLTQGFVTSGLKG